MSSRPSRAQLRMRGSRSLAEPFPFFHTIIALARVESSRNLVRASSTSLMGIPWAYQTCTC